MPNSPQARRHTSSTLVPCSFCFSVKAIWSSVNLLVLTTCSWPLQALNMPVVSVTKRCRILGQDQLDGALGRHRARVHDSYPRYSARTELRSCRSAHPPTYPSSAAFSTRP